MLDTVHTDSESATEPVRRNHVPGETGVWVFIFGEATMFTALFLSFMYSRSKNVDLFRAGQRSLHVDYGVIATLLLLTSSLCVVLAVRRIRSTADSPRYAATLIVVAALCGLGFVGLKVAEYTEKLQHDIAPSTNDFYMSYFMLTGIHLFHLVIGMAVLAYLWVLSRKTQLTELQVRYLEGGACYWHMVDFLWIAIFPLLYLVR